MPLHVRGSRLHGANAYRLANSNGTAVLTTNHIGSHPVYQMRVNNSNTYNSNHVRLLSNFIINKLKHYATKNTIQKLGRMVNSVFNNRSGVQKGHLAQYTRNLELIKARVTPLREMRKLLENAGQNTRNINRQIAVEDALFTAATNQWVRHQNQIKYWRWVKNVVFPNVSRRFLSAVENKMSHHNK